METRSTRSEPLAGDVSSSPEAVREPFVIENWTVDPALNRISRGEEATRLEPKVMDLLVYLANRPGQMVSREEIESVVWSGTVVSYDALTGAVQKLRRAFDDDSRAPRIIETISKKGYRLIAQVNGEEAGIDRAPPAPGYTSRTAMRRSSRGVPWWPIASALLLAAALAWILLATRQEPPSAGQTTPATASEPAIAILPFDNLSADPEHEYFSHGITEDLITDLSKIPGLLVIARNSVFTYQGSRETDRQIGEKLGVQYLLRGSVQRQGERLRINARLVDIRNGGTVWAERFDRIPSDVFAIQDEITTNIATSLQVNLAAERSAMMDYRIAAGIEAYDAFLRAQYQYGRGSRDSNERARELYRQAIAIDPGFGRAYGGLALTYFRDALDGYTTSPDFDIRQAAQLADRAMALNPNLPQVYFVRGQVEMFRRNHLAAAEEFDRALALRPSYADAYAALGWMLHFAGQQQKALEAVEKAIRLNPIPPVPYFVILGGIQYTLGQYADAVAILERGRAMDANPQRSRLRLWLAAAYAQSGRLDDAAWEINELTAVGLAPSLEQLERMFPFKDPAQLQHVLEGLRKAGLAI